MDQLNIGVTVDATSAPESLTKVSASIDKIDASAARMAVSQDQAARMIARTEAESRKFLASLKEEAESYGKSRDALLAYRASQLGVATEAKAFIDHIKEMKGENLGAEFGEKMKGGAESLRHSLELLGVAIGLRELKEFISRTIEAGAELGHMSQRLGINVEQLGAYKIVAQQSGMQLDEFALGVKKFSTYMVDHNDRLREAGITAKDTNGAMVQLAQMFHDMPDGALKTATATTLFGRAGNEMIPMLNKGAAGLQAMQQRAAELNPYTKEMIEQAEKLKAEQVELNTVTEKLGVSLSEKMLPGLVQTTKAMTEAAREGGLLKTIWVGLGGLGTAMFTNDFASNEEKVKSLEADAKSLSMALDGLKKNQTGVGFFDRWFWGDEKDLKSKLANDLAQIKAFKAEFEEAPKPSAKDSAKATGQANILRDKPDPVGNAFQDRLRALQDEGLKLDSQIEQWQKYGKAMDQSRAIIMEWDVAHDRILSKLPEERKAQLIAQARVDDEKAAVLVAVESKKTIEDKIRAIQAEASVQGIAKEATLQALLMKDLDSIKTRISKDDYDHLAASIRSSTAALEEKTATDAIKAQEGKTADEIKRIQQEADLIGKSALERQKLVEQLKIEAKARQDIARYPDEALAIQASAVKQVEEMNAVLDKAHAKLVSFDTGAAGAFKDYADNAANAAESARKLVGDSLTAMDDALLQFAKTGKLSFSSLVDSIMTDMDRMMIHALETKFFQTIGDSLGGSSDLGSIVGHIGNFLGGSQAPAPLVDAIPTLLAGGKASGGMVDRNSLYQVNENGPELLNYGGKDYLMMGGQAGYVKPVSSSSSNGGRPVAVVNHFHLSGPTDSRTQAQMATQAGLGLRRAMARNT